MIKRLNAYLDQSFPMTHKLVASLFFFAGASLGLSALAYFGVTSVVPTLMAISLGGVIAGSYAFPKFLDVLFGRTEASVDIHSKGKVFKAVTSSHMPGILSAFGIQAPCKDTIQTLMRKIDLQYGLEIAKGYYGTVETGNHMLDIVEKAILTKPALFYSHEITKIPAAREQLLRDEPFEEGISRAVAQAFDIPLTEEELFQADLNPIRPTR